MTFLHTAKIMQIIVILYLGFQLTPRAVLPGKDKLAAVRQARPPKDVHQFQQFVGLVNFFRTHVRNFLMVASPLTGLFLKPATQTNILFFFMKM